MKIRDREFDTENHTYVMGILNVTPDSFSDGGRYNELDKALYHVEQMVREGADIIDAGGESTRPGYEQISGQEEIERVVPVIAAIRERFDIPVSVDTYKSEVAREAIRAGADMVNDIHGLKYGGYDKEQLTGSAMAEVIAAAGVACCLMHNREQAVYQQFMPELLADMKETLILAEQAGISDDKIMLDPGIGFAKSYEQNLAAIQAVDQLVALGFPVLLGTSRKSVIGLTLDIPAAERMSGTVATTVYAVMKGCSFVRVHDVRENREAIQMIETILRH